MAPHSSRKQWTWDQTQAVQPLLGSLESGMVPSLPPERYRTLRLLLFWGFCVPGSPRFNMNSCQRVLESLCSSVVAG